MGTKVRGTASEVTEKWQRNMKGSTTDIKRGIERVTEAPTAAAARSEQKMRDNLVASVDSGKWRRGLERVTLEEWRQKAINKGLQRIPAGVEEARPKVEKFMTQLIPHIEAGMATVASMPSATLEDSISRMTTFVRHMAGFERR